MSAIFGIWNLNGSPINKVHADKMKEILTYYGMDIQDTYIHTNFVFGCCLNKINNFSQNDNPIFLDQNKEIVLVADALIYNRNELIKFLNLTENKNISNNELILLAYKKWGKDCPKYINGDFTFAIWDNNKITIVRDHIGIRPLYYYFDGSIFVFASDYRAILALPFVPKKINEKMIYNILINNEFRKNENTYFDGIFSLLPAHTLLIEKTGLLFHKYWTPGLEEKIKYSNEEEYFNALYDIVANAIKIRITNNNVDIGSEISGGLDSSVVTILANRELKKENRELSALFSWSPSFCTYEKQERDERVFIENICKNEKLDCTFFDINEALNSYNKGKITAVDTGQLFALTKETEVMGSKNIRLMLSGWGGDQGISHKANLFELYINKEWRCFFKEARFLSKGSIFKFMKIVLANSVFILVRNINYFFIKKKYIDNVENISFYKSFQKYRKKPNKYQSFNLVNRLESGEIQTRTELSAWLGAEYNVQYLFPFLDYHVIDFALSIPTNMFFKNGINRYIFRKAFERILPYELCYYVHKDDIARCTYRRSVVKNIETASELLEQCLNEKIFSKYLDFDKTRILINRLKKNEDIQKEHKLKTLLEFLYNIQKLLEAAEKDAL